MKTQYESQNENSLKKLKKILSNISLGDVVTLLNVNMRDFTTIVEKRKTSLSSPYQQSLFLLGLVLATPNTDAKDELTQSVYEEIIALLNEIFLLEVKKHLDEYNSKKRFVIGAFADYFYTGLKMSTDELREWIADWYSPYDSYFTETYGFNTNDLLGLSKLIETETSRKNKEIGEIFHKLEKGETLDLKDKILVKDNKSITNLINQVSMIELSQLESHPNISSILKVLAIKQGEAKDLNYITDPNELDFKPIIIDDEYLYFPRNNMYYNGLFNFFEREIYKKHPQSEKNLKARDKKLEHTTLKLFKELLGDEPNYWEGLSDKEGSQQFEHDLIISYKDTLLIIEAKASPPKEPNRDLDMSLIKIRDHFKSASGLQKAFNQANNFKKRLIDKRKIQLFKNRKKIVELDVDDYKNIFCICVTRDDYKSIGCMIDQILEKNPEDNYPWVLDINTLKNILMAWKHLKLDPKEIYSFIEQRLAVYGKVYGTDELEYVGAYLYYEDGLKSLIKNKSNFISLSMDFADIFDEIMYKEMFGEKYILKRQKFSADPTANQRSKFSNKKRKKSNLMQKKARRKNR